MNIDSIASQIRTLATVFNGNVAGAAGYANGVADQVWLPLPAAYVIPLEQEAEPNESQPGLYQIVHERVGVIVVLSTPNAGGALDAADRRGQAAAASLDTIRTSIFSAILNWRPDFDPNNPQLLHEARGLYFLGAKFPQDGAFDRARFFYEFSFALDTLVTDDDGWQQPSTPLTDISGTVTRADTGATLATLDAPLQG